MFKNDYLLRDGETDKGREMQAKTEEDKHGRESERARETITIGQIQNR